MIYIWMSLTRAFGFWWLCFSSSFALWHSIDHVLFARFTKRFGFICLKETEILLQPRCQVKTCPPVMSDDHTLACNRVKIFYITEIRISSKNLLLVLWDLTSWSQFLNCLSYQRKHPQFFVSKNHLFKGHLSWGFSLYSILKTSLFLNAINSGNVKSILYDRFFEKSKPL